MKKFLLKLISLISAFILVFTSVFTGGVVISAEDTTIAESDTLLIAKCDGTEGAIFHPGGATKAPRTFKGTNSAYKNNYIVKTNTLESMDISAYDTITFEMYYENQEAFAEWQPYMQIWLLDSSSNKAIYPMPINLEDHIYNKITIDLSLAAKSIDLASFNRVAIHTVPSGEWRTSYNNTIDDGYTSDTIQDFSLSIANIYANKKEDIVGETFIDAGAYSFWGSPDKSFNYANKVITLNESVDVSAYDYIEFDIYISDVDTLKAELASDGNPIWTGARFQILNSASENQTFSYKDTLKSGYNRIRIEVSSLNSTLAADLKSIKLYQERNSFAHVPQQNYVFGITNICGVTITPPKDYNGKLISAGANTLTWASGKTSDYAKQKISFEAGFDFKNYKYLEFDYYVSDLETLLSETNFNGFRFRVYKDEALSSYYNTSFTPTQSGWNRIRIELPDTVTTGYGVYWYTEKYKGVTASQNYKFRISNISAVHGDTFVLHEGNSETITWASGKNQAYVKQNFYLTDTEDMTESDYIEFDCYVDDIASLSANENYQGHRIWVRTSDETSTNLFKAGFIPTENGWNHIRLAKSNFENIGSPDWSTVKSLYIYMEKSTALAADKDYTLQYSNFTAVKASAKLYSIYGDNMIFQQNKEFKISGIGNSGLAITAKLLLDDTAVQTVEVTAAEDNTWEAVFEPMAGGYTEYSISIFDGEYELQTITGVRFGEVWLASGQSNMAMRVWETPEGNEMYRNGTFSNDDISIVSTPNSYSATDQKGVPQKEIGTSWVLGNTSASHNVSAVAYYFADKLQKELDVPVGIINASLGSTLIETWISREAIENDEYLLNYLMDNSKYISEDDAGWGTTVNYNAMTAQYNIKLAPFTVFEITGAIWYQGESNTTYEDGYYTKAMDVLLKDWSEKFGFEDSSLPFIFVHTAPYGRGGRAMQDFWEDMSDGWANHSDTVAQLPIYDLSLEWDYSEWARYGTGGDPIHPFTKKPVGERMATSAMSLVYGEETEYTAPVFESQTINGKYIDVKFSRVGDGLMPLSGNTVYGFAICEEDGIYVDANAEIISKDTVRVWNDNVVHPVSVTYAFNCINTTSNLASSKNGEALFMAAPFRSEKLESETYFTNQDWLTCDLDSVWHSVITTPSLYTPWQSDTATVAINNEVIESGTGSLSLAYTAGEFSAYTNLWSGEKSWRDVSRNFSNYKTLTFSVNGGEQDVTITALKLEVSEGVYVTAKLAVDHTETDSYTFEADSGWKKVTAKLDKLYNEDGTEYTGDLTAICSIAVEFTSEAESGTVYVDSFSLGVSESEPMDVNMDGTFDARDLVRIKKYCADNTLSIKEVTEDLDGEYGVGATDIAVLRKYLLELM